MTDALLRDLLQEIRLEHKERRLQFNAIEKRLTTLERKVDNGAVAIAECASQVEKVRKLAFEGDDSLRKRLRLVSDFAGMTDPHEGNGQ